MKLIYNIELNLKEKLYNFYEWEESDDIKYYSEIPSLKVTNEVFELAMNKQIKIDASSFELKNDNGIYILSTNYDTICVQLNCNGIVNSLSKIQLNDEEYILNIMHKEKVMNINYEEIKGSNNYSLLTRTELSMIKEIENYIVSIKENTKEIEFISYDLYNVKSKNYESLLTKIKNDSFAKIEYLYEMINILKLSV